MAAVIYFAAIVLLPAQCEILVVPIVLEARPGELQCDLVAAKVEITLDVSSAEVAGGGADLAAHCAELRLLAMNVDDAADRVLAKQCSLRTAQYFDALY